MSLLLQYFEPHIKIRVRAHISNACDVDDVVNRFRTKLWRCPLQLRRRTEAAVQLHQQSMLLRLHRLVAGHSEPADFRHRTCAHPLRATSPAVRTARIRRRRQSGTQGRGNESVHTTSCAPALPRRTRGRTGLPRFRQLARGGAVLGHSPPDDGQPVRIRRRRLAAAFRTSMTIDHDACNWAAVASRSSRRKRSITSVAASSAETCDGRWRTFDGPLRHPCRPDHRTWSKRFGTTSQKPVSSPTVRPLRKPGLTAPVDDHEMYLAVHERPNPGRRDASARQGHLQWRVW